MAFRCHERLNTETNDLGKPYKTEDRDRMMTNISIIIKNKQKNKEFGKPEKGRITKQVDA